MGLIRSLSDRIKASFHAETEVNPYIIFDALNYMVVILNEHGRIRYLNKAFCDFTAVDRDKSIGKPFTEIEPLTHIRKDIEDALMLKLPKTASINLGGSIFGVNICPIPGPWGSFKGIIVHYRNITKRVEIENELIRRNRELTVINTLSTSFISSRNIDAVLSDLLEKTILVTNFDCGCIVILEEDTYVIKAHKGFSMKFLKQAEEGELTTIWEGISCTDEPFYIVEDVRSEQGLDVFWNEGIMTIIGMCLRSTDKVSGILCLSSRSKHTIDFEDISLLSTISNQVALIFEKVRLYEETKHLSVTDGLTGLYNIRYFYEALDTEIARTNRYGTPFSLVILDIDDFKHYNDSFGHQAGDNILKAIAAILKRESRKTDILARYGGEEFISILPNTEKEEASILAERIRRIIADETFLKDLGGVKVYVSGGVATYPSDGSDSKSILYASDMALYAAKARGKKNIFCYRRDDEKDIFKAKKP